jgi:hypothetical protein
VTDKEIVHDVAMDNSPEASRLMLLSHLPDVATGTKVRFLGWYVGSRFTDREL